ncbi:MAG TPA: rhodanese-like domain-containing protein [Thermoanaerobaculia bacterium]
MTKRPKSPPPNQKKTTTVVAVATFLGFSLIAIVAWALTRPAAPAAPATQAATAAPTGHEGHDHPQFETITAAELKAGLDRNEIVVIDVRSIEQYKASHIPGSLHIPVPRVEGEIPYMPKDKTFVTYCTCPAEESSGDAALILASKGIKAKALLGGMDAWTQLGQPLAQLN